MKTVADQSAEVLAAAGVKRIHGIVEDSLNGYPRPSFVLSMEVSETPHRRDQSKRNLRTTWSTTMKIMFLTLAAVLGLALGACSPHPAPQGSQAWLYAPAPALNDN
jgi:hypothetical protein